MKTFKLTEIALLEDIIKTAAPKHEQPTCQAGLINRRVYEIFIFKVFIKFKVVLISYEIIL